MYSFASGLRAMIRFAAASTPKSTNQIAVPNPMFRHLQAIGPRRSRGGPIGSRDANWRAIDGTREPSANTPRKQGDSAIERRLLDACLDFAVFEQRLRGRAAI